MLIKYSQPIEKLNKFDNISEVTSGSVSQLLEKLYRDLLKTQMDMKTRQPYVSRLT